MKCSELADRIQEMQPDASSRDVARLCLLLSISSNDLNEMSDIKNLKSAWREMSLRLQAATDQHAAMTDELEALVAEFRDVDVDVDVQVVRHEG